MAKCDICGKGVTFGIKVSHSHRRSNRTWKPNVRRVKAIVNGTPCHIHACTRCLRSGKVTRALKRVDFLQDAWYHQGDPFRQKPTTFLKEASTMIVVNTDFISGKKLQTLSLVRGSTVHSKNLGRDILSSLKTIVGGEIVDYTNMMNEARAIATQRMVEDAQKLDADAVINVRYASSAIMQGAAEIIAYGTAVKFVEE